MRYDDEPIPDRSRARLPMTAPGVVGQGTSGNYVTAGLKENKRRKRGGRRAKRQPTQRQPTSLLPDTKLL